MLLKYLFSTQIKWCFICLDGKKYKGNWTNGKQHGYGRYWNQNGEDKFGFWRNGVRERWLVAH